MVTGHVFGLASFDKDADSGVIPKGKSSDQNVKRGYVTQNVIWSTSKSSAICTGNITCQYLC